MNVEAIMQCDAKEPSETEEGCAEVRLSAIVAEEGEQWAEHFKYTPYGEVRMGLLSPAAADAFDPGARYRVTFERVE